MSKYLNYADKLLKKLFSEEIEQLIVQSAARNILKEVGEEEEKIPRFSPKLVEKLTHVAFCYISCGCILIEKSNDRKEEGFGYLEKAGKILSNLYKEEELNIEIKNLNVLIAGMSLYASKYYSKAFILMKNIQQNFKIGEMILYFLKKDYDKLLELASETYFLQEVKENNITEYFQVIAEKIVAHIFLIIIEYVNTGNIENIKSLFNEKLKKSIYFFKKEQLILYWYFLRLLRIILYTFVSNSTWEILKNYFENNILKKYNNILSNFKIPVVEMWPSQKEALKIALNEEGGVINLRTSSGKTRVAELAILKILSQSQNSKIFYIAPFKSLAYEIEENLNKIFSPLGYLVSKLYDVESINKLDFELIENSNIVITTPEKMKALIRFNSEIKDKIKLIIIDEGHLIGEDIRHTKNEIFFTNLIEMARKNSIKMLLLSAVLPNADDLAEWITGNKNLYVKSNWKPSSERIGLLIWNGEKVRIEWKNEENPFNPNFIQKNDKNFPKNKNEAIIATAIKLSQKKSVMIYAPRTKSVETLAKILLKEYENQITDYKWDKNLWNSFQTICEEELGKENVYLKAMKKGIACHSNKLPTLTRQYIEKLMYYKKPKIVIATSTLGQGVNIGVSTVIISSIYIDKNPISKRDFWNICGRAGRAFSDIEGKILYTIDTHKKETSKIKKDKKKAEEYFDTTQLEQVKSGILQLLEKIYNISVELKIDFNLFIELLSEDKIENLEKIDELFDIIDDELLAIYEEYSDNKLDIIENIFKRSLAIIQKKNEKENFTKLLKARTKGLLKRFPNKRKKMLSLNLPLSIVKQMKIDREMFKNLAVKIIESPEKYYENRVLSVIKKIDNWCLTNANFILPEYVKIDILDKIRDPWLTWGASIFNISRLDKNAEKILKSYYSYSLPWIINGISQMFVDEDEQIAQIYNKISLYLEIGLINEIAIQIYLAGINSRRSSKELSELNIFEEKNNFEIKKILFKFEFERYNISDFTVNFLKSFREKHKKIKKLEEIYFHRFKYVIDSNINIIYLRKSSNKFYFYSNNPEFEQEVKSTELFPFFNEIKDLRNIYFERKEDTWELKSYNPRTQIKILK